jgi:hypothetical protein
MGSSLNPPMIFLCPVAFTGGNFRVTFHNCIRGRGGRLHLEYETAIISIFRTIAPDVLLDVTLFQRSFV